MYISPSPHTHANVSVQKCMRNVLIALLPAYIASLYYFGIGALVVSLISVASCVIFEFLITKYLLKRENTISDLSAVVTGLLLAFNLPSNLPWWIVVLGALFAIGIGKMAFGGLGNNPFNPALVGRVFLLISFPAQMTTWPRPIPFNTAYIDAETGATPLSYMKELAQLDIDSTSSATALRNAASTLESVPDYLHLLTGDIGGSMGEVCAIALIIGFIYLLCTKTITWHIPVSILATVALFTWPLHACNPLTMVDPLTQILTGGLLLGSIFMATDYATSPMTHLGQIIYGIGIGVITVVIRTWGSYPEGMSFAILIMNGVTPLINHYVRPKQFSKL